MALTFARTFDPFFPFASSRNELRTLCQFADEIDQAFARPEAGRHHTPNYRYYRGSDGLHLEVELPGVAKEHIEIEIHGSNLSITGRRFKEEKITTEDQNDGDKPKENEDADMSDKKSVAHVYKLRVKAGDNVDEGNIKAEHKNGMLNMFIPFKGDTGVRRIAISQL